MARPLRIDYPNAWHHVMNRTRGGADLFVDKTDYQQFIDLLKGIADFRTHPGCQNDTDTFDEWLSSTAMARVPHPVRRSTSVGI